ncbi:putative sulfate transporter [Cyphellophora attinorum]|uniref:Putative sulfate transporter n=1 Tax=Cyphellophora attinorum TaxID=1664694 RepID=A0A0N1HR64_9EURO|nr:putative sulfate transporter [Phialophora attinorum]KPI40656.1 putative sulfate transporter [Phialophora attinorum]
MSNSSPNSPPRSPPTSPRRPAAFRHTTTPTNPSRLRNATAISPEEITKSNAQHDGHESDIESPSHSPLLDGVGQLTAEPDRVASRDLEPESELNNPTETTGLLDSFQHNHHSRVCGLRNWNHGTFSPRAGSVHSRQSSFDSSYAYNAETSSLYGATNYIRGIFGSSGNENGTKSLSTTERLARAHGIRSKKYMYFSYYVPFVKWITQYQWAWFQGDLVAAFTMASFYIPMSLSYASNLGHIPPINGLYAFVFNPLVYALLGSCPQMVVGPEAAGSLLVGTVVTTSIDRHGTRDDDDVLNAQVAGVVTTIAGAVLFVAGFARLGFLDSVLSRPFLRGFISAIGFVIFIDQALPELGLSRRAEHVAHHSTADKFVFIIKNFDHVHGLTAAVSLSAFAIIMVFRELKNRLQPRYPKVAYVPDRFLVVALSAVLTWKFGWDKQGLDVLGHVKSSGGTAIPFHWPFQFKHMKHIDTALSTAFLIALLGFFESSVAAKSLGDGTSGLQGMNVSANRELIALGTANLIGGCFMALPAFGGYGRSKVNKSTGGTTPMSSILLSMITLICVFYALPLFYYLPKGVLSAMVSVVAYSLIEEAPHDIKFFFKIRGWTELSLMAIIFLATVFYSLSVGIALGIGLSLLSLIKHATKPRIQILGKVSGTANQYENAEFFPDAIEYLEGCLIVKITEPLTFANTGELKNRLRRLEKYGTEQAHPSLPRVRHEDSNRNIILDVHGVTSIDGSGTQVLFEIVEEYVKRGARVIFCRLPRKRSKVFDAFVRSGIVELCGGERHFVGSVDEALKISNVEDLDRYFDERVPNGQRDLQFDSNSLVA